MLLRLLQLIAACPSSSLPELAESLGVSQELVAAMIDRLADQGYLVAVGQGCDQPCRGCPLHHTCALATHARLWALTDRGRLALRRTT
ncbi:MAG: winged helix-turn-helix domain-containing protein [Anaerolineae bacterium]|nr:winged helix-turn-helix domain-containing protein [Anaerolineae bacterium]